MKYPPLIPPTERKHYDLLVARLTIIKNALQPLQSKLVKERKLLSKNDEAKRRKLLNEKDIMTQEVEEIENRYSLFQILLQYFQK